MDCIYDEKRPFLRCCQPAFLPSPDSRNGAEGRSDQRSGASNRTLTMPERRTTRSSQTVSGPGLSGRAVAAKIRVPARAEGDTAPRHTSDAARSSQLPGAWTPPKPEQTPDAPRVVQPHEPWQALLFSRRDRAGAAVRRAAQQAQRDAMSAAVAAGDRLQAHRCACSAALSYTAAARSARVIFDCKYLLRC